MTTENLIAEDCAVADSLTGTILDGECSGALAAASAAAGPEGHVSAVLDDAGVWQYVPASLVSLHRDQRHEDVRGVYVMQL